MQGSQSIERTRRIRNVEPSEQHVTKQARRIAERERNTLRASERQRKHADAL